MKKKPNLIRLENGLPFILIDLPGATSATVQFLTKVGQRDRGSGKAEIAHVLEHLVFDGTRQFPAKEKLKIAIDEIGADFNGSTAEEYTSYYFKVDPQNLDRAMLLLSQMTTAPLLKADQLEKEKKIIIQELNYREDDSIVKITDFLQETVFPHHPLGISRAQSLREMPLLTRQNLIDFWRKNYVSGSSVLAIAGDFGRMGGFRQLAGKEFAPLGAGEREPLEVANKEKPGLSRAIDKKTAQSHLAFGIRNCDFMDRRLYATKLLDIIFGRCFSSRLMTEIREKRRLAYAVMSNADFFTETGLFTVYAGVEAKRLPEAVSAIWQEAKKTVVDKAGGITEKELQKAKNIVRGRVAVELDNPAGLAEYYSKRQLFYHDLLSPQDLINRYERVKRNEVVAVARELFLPKRVNLVAMGEKIDIKKLKRLID